MMEMRAVKRLIVKPQFKYVRNSLLYCMPKTKIPFKIVYNKRMTKRVETL